MYSRSDPRQVPMAQMVRKQDDSAVFHSPPVDFDLPPATFSKTATATLTPSEQAQYDRLMASATFATVKSDVYDISRASLHIADMLSGDRTKVAPLVPLLTSLARMQGKTTLDQESVDLIVNLLKAGQKIGISANFAATDPTRARADELLALTPLGQQVLKARGN